FLDRFPCARGGRTKKGINDSHIPDRVCERNYRFMIFKYGSRKEISLNRILIADGKLSYLRVLAGEIGAVMNKDSSRLIGRRIERDLYFDSSARAAELHPLIPNELRTAGKACL